MSEKIVVDLTPLEDAGGNLKALLSNWTGSSGVSDAFHTSKGRATDYLKKVIALVPSLTENVTTLLDNSVLFFESLGYSFKDVDQTVARDIKKIGGSSNSGSSGGGESW